MVTLHASIFCEVALIACWMWDESGSLGSGLLWSGGVVSHAHQVRQQVLSRRPCPTYTDLLAIAKQVSRNNISSLCKCT